MAINTLQIQDQLTIKILDVIKERDCNRDGIIKEVNRPRTTVYDRIKKLIINNTIEEYKKPTGGHGRPYTFFRIKNNLNKPITM